MKIPVLFLTSLLLAFLSTPLVRRLCLKFELLDMPSKRKIHRHPLPRLGGVAIIFAFVTTILLAFYLNPSLKNLLRNDIPTLLTGSLIIIMLGLADDIFGLSPILKFIGQIAVALILFYSGLKVPVLTHPLSGQEMALPYSISLVVTVFWVIGMINAINLIDGIDGLAAGITFISGICLIFVGLHVKTPITVVLLSILCGSSLGFLFYNFPPAKIFLGDAGSMFLGFILAVSGLVGYQYKVATVTALIVPVCVLAIPIYDTGLAVWRRLLKKGSVFIADKHHLHHRFLQFGLTQGQTVLIFYLATAYFGIIAFLFILIPRGYALLLLVLMGIGIFSAMRIIGFIERRLKKLEVLEQRLKRAK